MNKERFGAFITEIRKERHLTQKDLAEKLHVTDKAVSKWERGLSYPDVTLMEPLDLPWCSDRLRENRYYFYGWRNEPGR